MTHFSDTAQTSPDTIIDTLKGVLPEGGELHVPSLDKREQGLAVECIESGWISSLSPFVNRFEESLGNVTKADYVIATSNGTAALHIALAALGIEHNDEVLLPSLTFVATANAIKYCGAHPHFVDIDEQTLGLDSSKLEEYLHSILTYKENIPINRHTGRPVKAVICMHTFGHPVDMDPLVSMCQRLGLVLIEDAAESLGSTYRSKHTGTFGKCGIISFNGNKIVTTGGGGALITNDKKLAERVRHLATTAKSKHSFEYTHDEVGYNYRMPGINAAIGCAQLEKLPRFLKQKRSLAEAYHQAFSRISDVTAYLEQSYAKSNYWLNTIILSDDNLDFRNAILEKCHFHGIHARPAWKPLHQLEHFMNCCKSDLSVTENLSRRIINLPSSPILCIKK